MSQPSSSRQWYCNGIDWLRGIAAFGIVGCHLNLAPTTAADTLLRHFCDMNVGVFGCISGFLLGLSVAKKDIISVLKSRAVRILPVYAVWTFIYIAASLAFDVVLEGGAGPKFFTSLFWLSSVFNGGASCHLWYMSALFYGTLVFSFVLWAIKSMCARLIVLVAMSLAFHLLSFLLCGNIWYYTIRLFAFMAAGIVLYELKAMHTTLPKSAVLFSLAVVAAFSLKRDLWPHHFVPDYLLAILLVSLYTRECFKVSNIGAFLGRTSFGVYILHPLVTAGLGVPVRKFCVQPYSASVVIADWIGAYLISLAATFVALRIPFIRKFVV